MACWQHDQSTVPWFQAVPLVKCRHFCFTSELRVSDEALEFSSSKELCLRLKSSDRDGLNKRIVFVLHPHRIESQ